MQSGSATQSSTEWRFLSRTLCRRLLSTSESTSRLQTETPNSEHALQNTDSHLSTTSRVAAVQETSLRTLCRAADSFSIRRHPRTRGLWQTTPYQAYSTTECPMQPTPGCRTGAGTVTTDMVPHHSQLLTGFSSTCRKNSAWAASSSGQGPTADTT